MFKREEPKGNMPDVPAEEFIESEVHSRPIETAAADAELAKQVVHELSDLETFDPGAIEVSVREGIVTIEGTVASSAESILAGNTARSVDGVRAVTNHLEVSQIA
jgi:osmotically-inducible protein OsmY